MKLMIVVTPTEQNQVSGVIKTFFALQLFYLFNIYIEIPISCIVSDVCIIFLITRILKEMLPDDRTKNLPGCFSPRGVT